MKLKNEIVLLAVWNILKEYEFQTYAKLKMNVVKFNILMNLTMIGNIYWKHTVCHMTLCKFLSN